MTPKRRSLPLPTRTPGVVRLWHDEKGWGIVDSAETPGGCWVHYSAVRSDHFDPGIPRAGQAVEIIWEPTSQDRWRFVAGAMWLS